MSERHLADGTRTSRTTYTTCATRVTHIPTGADA